MYIPDILLKYILCGWVFLSIFQIELQIIVSLGVVYILCCLTIVQFIKYWYFPLAFSIYLIIDNKLYNLLWDDVCKLMTYNRVHLVSAGTIIYASCHQISCAMDFMYICYQRFVWNFWLMYFMKYTIELYVYMLIMFFTLN